MLSLIAIIPAFSAAGQLQFGFDDTAQEWAMQGGEVKLQVDDSDLDQPIKYVLLPVLDLHELMSDTGTSTHALSGTLTVAATVSSAVIMVGDYSTDTAGEITLNNRLQVGGATEDNVPEKLFAGDTVLVEILGIDPLGETVREVTKIEVARMATTTASVSDDSDRDGDPTTGPGADPDRKEVIAHYVTLNHPLSKDFQDPANATRVRLYKVVNANAAASDCPTCAMAPSISPSASGVELSNGPIMDSGLGELASLDSSNNLAAGDESNDFYEQRFTGPDSDDRVNDKDVLLVRGVGDTPTNVDATITIGSDSFDIDLLTDGTADVDSDNDEVAGGDGDRVLYWGSDRNTTANLVDVRSSADSAWKKVVLTESKKTSGVFQASILLTSGDSDFDNRNDDGELMPMLRVNDSGRVTMRFSDDGTRRTKALNVESTPPVLSNFSPSHNQAGVDGRPDFNADVTDSDSGVVTANVFVVFATLEDDPGMAVRNVNNGDPGGPHSVSVEEDGRLKEITGGYRVELRLPNEVDTDDDSIIAWWVVAMDKAGNVQVSDQDTSDDSPCDSQMFLDLDSGIAGASDYSDPANLPSLEALNTVATDDDPDDVAGCQPFIVKVDNTEPAMGEVETGVFWDTSIDESDKTNTDANNAMNTSVRVMFDEALDGSTVDRSDFEVDGKTPLGADHYSGAPMSVFLTVPALDPDETPEVELVGEVADLAGNAANSGISQDDETEDGIAPSVTVTLMGVANGMRPITDSKVTITIVTDENTANPDVTVRKVVFTDADGNGYVEEETEVVPTPKVKSPRTYETTFTATDDGLYNVYVIATDGPNTGSAGVSGMMDVDDDMDTEATNDDVEGTVLAGIDLSSDTTALLVEVDSDGPTFVLNPMDSDDPNAFVRIDFSAEGSENPLPVMAAGDDTYFGGVADGDDAATYDGGEDEGDDPDTMDVDTYGMVTILSATLGGDDISGSLERLDDNSFLIAAPNLAVDEYKIVIDAEDSAGNDNESSQTLTITERKPFVLNIRAGVSLISFPGDPVDPDINSVFPADHPVQEVITYNPTQPGLWFAAKRDETTGMLDGNLMTIAGGNAYLVRSASSKSVNVIIDRPSSHDLITPPQIDLVGGWNLVPVLDVSFQLKEGDEISFADYFGPNDAINRVYGVNTVLNRLELVNGPTEADAEGDPLVVGKGYWVFASEATSIAPGVSD